MATQPQQRRRKKKKKKSKKARLDAIREKAKGSSRGYVGFYVPDPENRSTRGRFEPHRPKYDITKLTPNQEPWQEWEIDILKECYPHVGSDKSFWQRELPGRSLSQIIAKSEDLDLWYVRKEESHPQHTTQSNSSTKSSLKSDEPKKITSPVKLQLEPLPKPKIQPKLACDIDPKWEPWEIGVVKEMYPHFENDYTCWKLHIPRHSMAAIRKMWNAVKDDGKTYPVRDPNENRRHGKMKNHGSGNGKPSSHVGKRSRKGKQSKPYAGWKAHPETNRKTDKAK